MKVELRPRALADLDAIWDYTAERWGVAQADRYVADLWSTMVRLPNGSADAAHVRPGLRRARSGAHLIYFLVSEAIDVVRILHERQSADDL